MQHLYIDYAMRLLQLSYEILENTLSQMEAGREASDQDRLTIKRALYSIEYARNILNKNL